MTIGEKRNFIYRYCNDVRCRECVLKDTNWAHWVGTRITGHCLSIPRSDEEDLDKAIERIMDLRIHTPNQIRKWAGLEPIEQSDCNNCSNFVPIGWNERIEKLEAEIQSLKEENKMVSVIIKQQSEIITKKDNELQRTYKALPRMGYVRHSFGDSYQHCPECDYVVNHNVPRQDYCDRCGCMLLYHSQDI